MAKHYHMQVAPHGSPEFYDSTHLDEIPLESPPVGVPYTRN